MFIFLTFAYGSLLRCNCLSLSGSDFYLDHKSYHKA